MSLNKHVGGRSEDKALYVRQAFGDETKLYYNGNGLDVRLRQDNYPAIIRIGSVHVEMEPGVISTGFGNNDTNRISIGMPSGSNDNLYQKPATSGTMYLSSTSTNDTSAGTGARTVFMRGLIETSPGIYEEASETITLNGQTAVATSLDNWFRVNLLFITSAGTLTTNDGNIYCGTDASPTAGVPSTGNTVLTICLDPQGVGFGISTQGDYAVGTFQTFVFNYGNIFTNNIGASALIRERYTQPFNSTTYQIGYYGLLQTAYNYTGAGSYTAETDVRLEIFDTAGSPVQYFTYYINFVLVDNRLINATPIGFAQT